ncbi:MAG: 16S rRNA (uracil(1498)-N(3))-methyltransferase [Gammaproteobacteria bacterium]|nr:MAG: 16S rRNA (uracil(1498)-N(3))-methyltransferase [Gammaproteobacteria bacterium]
MRIPRIYQPYAFEAGSKIQLDASGAAHVGRVLRMQPGQQVCLFNGEGGEYLATLVEASKKSVCVSIDHFNPENYASPLPIHLGQVISRGERMDYALQKAVELGVSEITPLFSLRCEVKLSGPRLDKRMQQWQHQIISACEQCGLNLPPKLNTPQQASSWFEQVKQPLKWILHPGETPLNELLCREKPEGICIAIGPEGGFAPEEITAADNAGFTATAIGPRVFRTETAPVVAISLLQQQWGDF